ncbi:GntR family transcriptional regulator [Cellulosimicrobium funkei]|uniref:GntR family transcriptional regulator n=1 Tax=Cellulosimicrobium funkei TaxID=264251 RepID=A0A4Y8R743_9MICO|nr:GntR family transcriptional regulator [Cellulosimicrobium funkei]TFF17337.1 GntR family transcriptional regulator [Cellulosimicrobium funkei]TGA74135.1 GntR family transcriptional regulator [Cellulosimicrobium terreum]
MRARTGPRPDDPGARTDVVTASERATTSLRDAVYARLRGEILDGRIDPRERLTEPKLGRRFGVSRTPVREALSRLLSDGLVERTDFGYAVVVPSLAELRDLDELRVTLELRGLDRVIENPGLRHDTDVLRAELARWVELRATPPRPDPGFVLLDERFHTALSRAAGNERMTQALVEVNEKVRAVRRYDFVEDERVRSTVDEHVRILELVLADRLPEARTALHHHVGASLAVVTERAARALARMAVAG